LRILPFLKKSAFVSEPDIIEYEEDNDLDDEDFDLPALIIHDIPMTKELLCRQREEAIRKAYGIKEEKTATVLLSGNL